MAWSPSLAVRDLKSAKLLECYHCTTSKFCVKICGVWKTCETWVSYYYGLSIATEHVQLFIKRGVAFYVSRMNVLSATCTIIICWFDLNEGERTRKGRKELPNCEEYWKIVTVYILNTTYTIVTRKWDFNNNASSFKEQLDQTPDHGVDNRNMTHILSR